MGTTLVLVTIGAMAMISVWVAFAFVLFIMAMIGRKQISMQQLTEDEAISEAGKEMKRFNPSMTYAQTIKTLEFNRDILMKHKSHFKTRKVLDVLHHYMGLAATNSQLTALGSLIHTLSIEEQAQYADMPGRALANSPEEARKQILVSDLESIIEEPILATSVGNAAYLALHSTDPKVKEHALKIHTLFMKKLNERFPPPKNDIPDLEKEWVM